MCNFLSVITDAQHNIYYADWSVRKKRPDLAWDSHTLLAERSGLVKKKESYNSYEINPWNGGIIADSVTLNDSIPYIKQWFKSFDKNKLCPMLSFEKIPKPKLTKKLTNEDIINLYNHSILMHYHNRDLTWKTLSVYEAKLLDRMLDSVNLILDGMMLRASDYPCILDRGICTAATGYFLKVKNWSAVNKQLISEQDLKRLKNFDINKNPYCSAMHLWRRGLVVEFISDWIFVENIAADRIFSQRMCDLKAMVDNMK